MELISQDLNTSLNAQIAHEKLNAQFYLFIAGDLRNRGFNRLAEHFEKQHAEETEHALMIYRLLTDLNSQVRMDEIPEVKLQISSILDVSSAYLQREVVTTQSLEEIEKQAIVESNPVVEEALRKMICLQQAEYNEAKDFEDHALLCGGDWFKVMLWDGSLG